MISQKIRKRTPLRARGMNAREEASTPKKKVSRGAVRGCWVAGAVHGAAGGDDEGRKEEEGGEGVDAGLKGAEGKGACDGVSGGPFGEECRQGADDSQGGAEDDGESGAFLPPVRPFRQEKTRNARRADQERAGYDQADGVVGRCR